MSEQSRFFSTARGVYERVAGRDIEHNPFELRARAEMWMRAAVELEETDFPRARLYARSAFEAQCALTIWEQHYKAVYRDSPFKEEVA